MIIANGYARTDGRIGIRNVVAVIYLVECAHHVARRVVDLTDDADVHLLGRSEEHTSELQSLMRISYAVFCLKKKTKEQTQTRRTTHTARPTHYKRHKKLYNTLLTQSP